MLLFYGVAIYVGNKNLSLQRRWFTVKYYNYIFHLFLIFAGSGSFKIMVCGVHNNWILVNSFGWIPGKRLPLYLFFCLLKTLNQFFVDL
jgi:hypothetical protein